MVGCIVNALTQVTCSGVGLWIFILPVANTYGSNTAEPAVCSFVTAYL